jgi:DMSO/TMAO reductase YedYZ molybdopterin-dependent catalytic subunit
MHIFIIGLAALSASASKPELVTHTVRPPNVETPVEVFNEVITPNDKFFVRYHLANIPKVALKDWKLTVGGDAAEKSVTFTAQQLKKEFKQVEVTALAFCSGNRRGLVDPRVPGVQWEYGAMGNARWKGVRLKDVLDRVGLKATALEIVFDGADGPVLEKTPDYRKSLPLKKALDEDTLIAFEMNGKPLPQDQGFPARIVVPGWTATYWVKHLISIDAISKPFDGFWMKTAYRIPKGKFPDAEVSWPSQETATTTPITEIAVSSLLTNVRDGQHFKRGRATELKGLAWDGGHGIAKVETSFDDGKTWQLAKLGKDYGRYSWRQFTASFKPETSGDYILKARATNTKGATQPVELTPNPGGYHHNKVQTLHVQVDTRGPASVPTDESHIKLIDAPGRDRVQANCITCHSLDYIPMNAKILDRAGWEKEVDKMVKVMGAPVSPADAAVIIDYLAKNYGR